MSHEMSPQAYAGRLPAFQGLATEDKPAFTLKLCNNLSGSNDLRKAVFRSSRCLTHEEANSTSWLGNGNNISVAEGLTAILPPASIRTATQRKSINQ